MKFEIKNQHGEIIRSYELLEKQAEFINSDKRYLLFSGGFGGGKSFALILKVLYLLRKHPNNLGILGRLHYQDLRDSVQRDFFAICPKIWIKNYVKSEKKVILFNDSELLFRHLDKISEQEIKSLNLGFFAIDQMEQITEPVFLALKGRLRRKNTSQQGFMTSNPANTWLYREFKQDSRKENHLIEISTLENRANLPQQYIEDMLRYPDSWKNQFVYGLWDSAIQGDRYLYPRQYIDGQRKNVIEPKDCKYLDDIRIYQEKINRDDTFQMGVDTSEGLGGDASVLSVVNTRTGEEAAFWQGQMAPDVLAFKAKQLVDHFNMKTKDRMTVIPEVNSIGIAFLNQFKKLYSVIYRREVFLKQYKERKEILGWKTSVSTKPLLINNHVALMRENLLSIHTPELLEQMSTFAYTDEVKRQGMGADYGFHDDAVIAHALACFMPPKTKMTLMSSDKQKSFMAGFNKKTYKPHDEPLISDLFKKEYNWLTDSVNYD